MLHCKAARETAKDLKIMLKLISITLILFSAKYSVDFIIKK